MDEIKICNDALAVFGQEHQVRKLAEEMAELMVAISHHIDGRGGVVDIAEEIADVRVVLTQMELLFGCGEYGPIMLRRKMEKLAAAVDLAKNT